MRSRSRRELSEETVSGGDSFSEAITWLALGAFTGSDNPHSYRNREVMHILNVVPGTSGSRASLGAWATSEKVAAAQRFILT